MGMQEFVGEGWEEHGTNAEAVFDRLPQGLDLVEAGGDALNLSALIVHVAGEHLGRWSAGLGLLDQLLAHPACADDAAARAALRRSQAVLHHCAGSFSERDACLAEGLDPSRPEASSTIRVWAIATSALAGQGRTEEAVETFRKAIDLAGYGPSADDPAARALAISSNNLACELELRNDRGPVEDELLREASRAARRFWEISGTWTNVERAEYRLAMTHLALGEPEAALGHARRCLEICEANGAAPGEFVFAHEARAKALHASGSRSDARRARDEARQLAAKITDDGFRSFCEGELDKLDALLGAA